MLGASVSFESSKKLDTVLLATSHLRFTPILVLILCGDSPSVGEESVDNPSSIFDECVNG